MKYTWAETIAKIVELNKKFCSVHQTPSKDLTEEQHAYLKTLRQECIAVTEARYELLAKSRKLGIPVELVK